jgi:hypothetical protein
MSVVEFIVALKGVMELWVVDYALRIIVPLWGLAGVILSAVYLGISSTEVSVRLMFHVHTQGCQVSNVKDSLRQRSSLRSSDASSSWRHLPARLLLRSRCKRTARPRSEFFSVSRHLSCELQMTLK